MQLLSDNGIPPEKLLLCKRNALRENKEPMDSGILPERLLLPKFK